ncbi:primosomal protein N' [Crenobacter sp. SG2305]|uniref:primosomal protein N' n=1 Tax=Crenobacter oryzisoli TaxID=3056844 RepID=UPI0025AA48DE|nr:primosomal protein N' [Crenobacter sp. SG2305]MDN0084931.1 primosomal protein N' [Crenobacter sp. SG2305]
MSNKVSVQVAVNVPLSMTFTYLADKPLPIGCRVRVPFRGGEQTGVVVDDQQSADVPAHKLKHVESCLDEIPPLPADFLELIRFTAQYYRHPIGQALFAALPGPLRRPQPARWPDERGWQLTLAAHDTEGPPPRQKARHALWHALAEPLSYQQAKVITPQAPALLKQWLAEGLVERVDAEPPLEIADGPVLNDEQAAAVEAVAGSFGQFTPWLLNGITGSGKTEVYLRLIERVLAAGQQVLVLVPEINLTPQLVERFARRFPATPLAALHSGLADGERLAGWLAAWRGSAGIVIGTRLAAFTPLARGGLIIVDEEHDGSFKQQDELRYHARDLAVWRARQAGVPIVLGSATPSLESVANVEAGRYRELSLTRRAHGAAALPTVRLIDIRRQKLLDGLAEPAIAALRKRVERKELSLVYVNRRGYAPVIACTECGWLSGCPHCSARLVWHVTDRRLHCHHCGYHEAPPRACPDCGNSDLKPMGQGTQRIEEALIALLPGARVLRIDRDTVGRKDAWEAIYRKVHGGEVDVLIGTQMLAKGHDFPALSLVLVLNADGGLYSADFRASERLFAQLSQVAGRAGRADTPGEVLVQTQWPEHPLYQALVAHDVAGFAAQQLAERREAGFPPAAFQVAVRADARTLEEASAFLDAAAALAEPPEGVTLAGPAPALMMRLANRERAHLLVESPQRVRLHTFLDDWLPLLAGLQQAHRQVRWSIDVDPQDF